MAQERIYLDATAGQVWSTAADILPAAANYGWSLGSGFHSEAARTRHLVETALSTLAAAWDVDVQSIIPVHNLANAFAVASQALEGEVAYSPICRKGLIQTVTTAAPQAQSLTVDRAGYIDMTDLAAADWFVLQAGNHEVGSVDDLAEIESRTQAKQLVDATEWAGRMPTLPNGDVIVTRSSAWGGPMSVCFVIFRHGAPGLSARQRQMLSPEPALIATAISALERVGDIQHRQEVQQHALTALAAELSNIDGLQVHGDMSRPRLPHLLSFSVNHVDAEALSTELDKRGFAVGAASACVADSAVTSHVLEAMGVSTSGNIRVSLPLETTAAELETFAAAVKSSIKHLIN